jgi:predicted short-subunit dehydrogenase-like oxidoreductase (DUF2520 family)
MAGDAVPKVGIIGLGRLGTALALALDRAGVPPAAIASRDAGRASSVAARLAEPPRVSASPEAVLEAANLVFLTVPDAAVAGAAAALPWGTHHAAVHCSGALGLEALAAAAAKGAGTGCFHPLQTFTPGAGPGAFEGIACGIEATGGLAATLEVMARTLGARPFSLAGADRALYHAAAVFASNYVVAVSALAQRTWARAGLDPAAAREALAPLTRAAAENAASLDPVAALTGPLARGDAGTVARHLRALAGDAPAFDAYTALARSLLAAGIPADAAARARLAVTLDTAGLASDV